MKYIVAIIYYGIIGAAIVLIGGWVLSDWKPFLPSLLVGGSFMLVLFMIGVIRGIRYEKKHGVPGEENEIEEVEETTIISDYLSEARDRAIKINAPGAVIVELSQAYADLRRECDFTKEKARARLDLINRTLTYNQVEDEELSDIIGHCYQCLWY